MQPLDRLASDLFDAVNAGLIVVNADQHVVTWNDWMAAACGISEHDAHGKTLAELFPGSKCEKLGPIVREAIVSGASRLLTHSLHPNILPLRTRAGRVLVHDVTIKPIGQKPYELCLIQIVDVTVTAERERVLRERQNARYAAVVDYAPDAVVTLDSEGVIQFANPAANNEFGYSAGLVGLPLQQLFDDQDAWTKTWQSLLDESGRSHQVEMVARRADGSASFLELSAARWTTDGRQFVSAILRDVNDRHRAEAELRRLNETLEERVATTLAERKILADIVESTDAVIQVLDQDFRILAVNQACSDQLRKLYGRAPKLGESLLDILADYPIERRKVRDLWQRALDGEEFTIIEELGGDTGKPRHFEIKFNRLNDSAGKQFAAFQFVYDVTERLEREAQFVRTEEALRQSQKMEALGQLTGGIAHDFNNLLTGIIGAMDILKRRIGAGRFDDTQRFMDAAVASANRAASMTHRLLAFARQQPLDPKATDANRLITGMEELLRRTLSEQIRLTIDLANDLWQTLTDANQLENAVLNLVINARDAMDSGGELKIVTRNITLDEPIRQGGDDGEAGEFVVISVQDTGSGMSPEVIAKAFDPFFTTKPIGQGTGLGLSMIYGFAKQSRGHVRIHSIVGEGTDVSIYLPRASGWTEFVGGQPAQVAPQGRGESVLFVEDESSVRLLIGEVLRDLGYTCIEAVDAKGALPILKSNARIDLLITDVGLPGMDGRELAEIARQHRPALKILFVTGYAKHATGNERFLDDGMAMVTKPFSLDNLAMRIQEILSGKV